jgi:PPIC-type PPIASE domain
MSVWQGGLKEKRQRPARLRARVAASLSALAIAALSVACGSGDRTAVVVRVGDASITKAAVGHWTRAIERGATVGSSLEQASGGARGQALALLISANRLIGDAAQLGRAVPDDAVDRAFEQRVGSLPEGRPEFDRDLASVGETDADVKLEIKAELAAARIRNALAGKVAEPTPAEIATYYKHNVRRYRVPEKRNVELIESLESPAAAEALGRRLGSGPRFARIAFHELVTRPPRFEVGQRYNGALLRAIFSARPGRLEPPAPLNRKWALFIVRTLMPASVEPLAQVRTSIFEHLLGERREQLVAEYSKSYRRRWRARTRCGVGYIVAGCRQYTGSTTSEPSPFEQ